MENPKEVAHHLDQVVGAVEHGLFLGLTSQVFVGGREGVRILTEESGRLTAVGSNQIPRPGSSKLAFSN